MNINKEVAPGQFESIQKPVFGESVTPDVSAQAIAEIEARNPGISQKSKELTEYMNNLMDGWALKSGLVNKETLDAMRAMYPDYVPTYRDRSDLARPMSGMQPGVNVLKKATGSSRDLLPLDQQIAELTNKVVKSSRKNEMYNAIQDMFESDPDRLSRFYKPVSKEKQAVEEGLKTNQKNIKLFELNGTGVYITSQKENWRSGLQDALDYYIESEQYEKCSHIQDVIILL
jgi:hypothetical protein